MAVIHPRFRSVMLERLRERLINVQGDTAVLCRETLKASDLGLGRQTTHIKSLDDRQWDSLICVGELWRLADLGSVAQALKPAGRLFFVEPVAGFGLALRAQRMGRTLIRARFGLSFETDLPQALRDVGITPTSTDRFRAGNPMLTFAAGEARVY